MLECTGVLCGISSTPSSVLVCDPHFTPLFTHVYAIYAHVLGHQEGPVSAALFFAADNHFHGLYLTDVRRKPVY